MNRTSLTYLEKTVLYVKPRRVSWILSNLVVFLIVILTIEEVIVDPGQGGRIDVFIWPGYWGYYNLTDTPMFMIPRFNWTSLILNYLYGIVPLYIAINIGVNAFLAEKYKNWQPSPSRYSWLGILLFLLITHIPAVLFGFVTIVLWLAMTATALGVTLLNLVDSDFIG